MENPTIKTGQKISTYKFSKKAMAHVPGRGTVLYVNDFVVLYTLHGRKHQDTRGGFLADINAGFISFI